MGFIPLPLGVVMIRVIGSAIRFDGVGAPAIFALAYLCLVTFRYILRNNLAKHWFISIKVFEIGGCTFRNSKPNE